ncbi:MAG: hypothetical protein HYX84_08540 [Chloroflexi bacterium]|nr:hypothetical protein [Chloroflexota bacterium]
MTTMKPRVRKATMTNKERMEALLRRERPDRVPFLGGAITTSFAVVQNGGTIADRYIASYDTGEKGDRVRKMVYEAEKKAAHDFDWIFAPMIYSRQNRGAFGGEVKLPTNKYSQGAFVTKYAADTPEEVMALAAPDVKACFTSEMIDFYWWVYEDKDENKPFVIMNGSSFNTVAGIAGYDNMCKWMLKEPEVARHLCRLAADYEIARGQYFKEIFGVENVLPLGASAAGSNQLISPKHFEQFALPFMKETHEKYLAMGYKHLCHHPCGEHNRNMPYWAQVPLGKPGIFWLGNEVELATAAKYFPNDIIAGNLETTVIQCGTPGEVYEAARQVIEKGKSLDNGFILMPACELPPLAPVENVKAITRALNDFGWYD